MRSKWGILIAIIYAIAAAAFAVMIYLLDVLPMTYFAGLIAALVIISAILVNGLFSKKHNKLRVVAGIIAGLLTLGFIAGSATIYGTLTFIDDVTSENVQIHNYHVVVRADSPLQTLDEIEGKTVSVQSLTDEKLTRAKEELNRQVPVVFDEKETVIDLAEGLINGDTEVIYLNSAYYEMLLEDLDDFTAENTRILATLDVAVEVDAVSSVQVDVTKEPFSIYVSGIDATGSISNVARSDVNMVVTVNPVTKEVLLTSIPRDYYVKLASYGEYDKLTHSGIYGIEETVSTVENLLGIEIPFYVKVNFTTVTTMVDALGGITVNSDYAFTSRDGYYYEEGLNELNGEEALSFARERKAFAEGDHQRVKNQQAVITGVINKITGSTAILTSYNDLLTAMADNIEMNLSAKAMTSLVKMQLSDMSSWNIDKCSLSGTGNTMTTYTTPSSYAYVMEPDLKSIEQAKIKIAEVSGEMDLEEEGTEEAE